MNIILTGFQGSGKTTCATLLANRLSLPHFDTDALLLERFEVATISALFDALGEKEFRLQEDQVLSELKSPYVLSLGGGALRESARTMGCVVYLFLPKDKLRNNPGAAYLRNRSLEDLFNERHDHYQRLCHHVIDNTDLAPEETVELILQKVGYGK